MKLSIRDKTFLNAFEHVKEFNLDPYQKNSLNLFVLRINANEFDYDYLIESLIEPVITFSLSRKVSEDYASKPGHLVKKASEKFVASYRNTGELGELLLYAFLECHLHAPKILSKLELKTSSSLYVNGADGVHYLKLPNGNYQLIFGESKTIADLSEAIKSAFSSIYDFKNEINEKGNPKSGINYEKHLISDNITKEGFSSEDIAFLSQLIFPSKNNDFVVDDAFAIFIGYEIRISEEDLLLPNDIFADKIKSIVQEQISQKIQDIQSTIKEKKLSGHSFHIYILPFTDLSKNRTKVLKEILL